MGAKGARFKWQRVLRVFSPTSLCVHIGGALGHCFAPLRLLTVYSNRAKAAALSALALPPLPRLALFVDSHWYAWLYPCERTASNSRRKKNTLNRAALKRTHIRDADVCGADVNKHKACAIGAQRGISAFFPSPTLPLHSFHLLGKKIKNNATVLWSNRRQGNNNDELSCRERRSRLMTKQEHSGIPLQAWRPNACWDH